MSLDLYAGKLRFDLFDFSNLIFHLDDLELFKLDTANIFNSLATIKGQKKPMEEKMQLFFNTFDQFFPSSSTQMNVEEFEEQKSSKKRSRASISKDVDEVSVKESDNTTGINKTDKVSFQLYKVLNIKFFFYLGFNSSNIK